MTPSIQDGTGWYDMIGGKRTKPDNGHLVAHIYRDTEAFSENFESMSVFRACS